MSTVPIAQGLVECRVMQHTPGPWRVERQNPSPTTGEWMISGAKPGYLAEVRDCGSGDVAANAKLIAAAPDLLAAIEAMRVAGGAAEFQAAFDKAKKLAMVHNPELSALPKAIRLNDLLGVTVGDYDER